MNKLGTIILVGLLALATFVSPVVLANTSNGYFNTAGISATCRMYGPGAGAGMSPGIGIGLGWQDNGEAFAEIVDILAYLSGYDVSSLTVVTQDYNSTLQDSSTPLLCQKL